MKKNLLLLALFATTLVSTAFSQTATADLSALLPSYYGVKDALVAGDAKTAATQAGELLKIVGDIDPKKLPPAAHTAFLALQDKLAMDARHISEVTNIGHQREHFASLSANMYTLAKTVSLSDQPVYQEYCPMKKTYWLSRETTIRNPYFGSAMLTCGKVTATLKP